jgi:GH25 family lysozyme M1 (1,4-beta-N-acetylmuramidase)
MNITFHLSRVSQVAAFIVVSSLCWGQSADAGPFHVGDILVADRGAFFRSVPNPWGYTSGAVLKVNSVSGAVTTISECTESAPWAPWFITLVADGGLFVSNDHNPLQLVRVDPVTGGQALVISPPYHTLLWGLTVDSDDQVLVAASQNDTGGVNGVLKLNPATGTYTTLSQWASDSPHDLAIEPSGAIVVSSMSGAVYRVSPTSGTRTLLSASDGHYGYGIVVDQNGEIFQITSAPAVYRIDPASGVRATVSTAGLLNYPYGLAIEANGNLIIGDAGAGRLLRVNPNTGVQTVAASASPLTQPFGVTVVRPLFGIDVSDSAGPATASVWGAVRQAGRKFVVVAGWKGLTQNQYAAFQLAGARGAGLATAGYCLLNFTSALDGRCQVKKALRAFGTEAAYLKFLAIDVEPAFLPPNYQSPSAQQAAVNRIGEAVTEVTLAGLAPVIYSKQNDWDPITGGCVAFGHIPLWLVQYNGVTDLPTVNFGGWTASSAKQYSENTTLAGIQVDLNAADGSLFSAPAPVYRFPPPHIRFSLGRGVLTLDWCDEDAGYILEQSVGPSGPWSPVAKPANPFGVDTSDPTAASGAFFRLRSP